MSVSRAILFATLPPERAVPLQAPRTKVVVLDDDPTGTQTVHGIPVLTEWSVASLADELRAPGPCFYVLTNSRALDTSRTRVLIREVGENLAQASRETGVTCHVVSRSDSTLRGHYPLEIDTLTEILGGKHGFDATFLIPAFFDGGRFTVGDVHYVSDGDSLIPAGETEFARDATFGYRSSNLRAWVQEKTAGRVSTDDVASLAISDLRGDPQALNGRVASFTGSKIVIVNAVASGDLHAFVAALHHAEGLGRNFIFRTAASFVAVYAGIAPKPLLETAEIATPGKGGGLVIAGSYVGKTSAQLDQLFRHTSIARVEIAVEKLLDPVQCDAEQSSLSQRVDLLLSRGENVVVYTSRKLVTGSNAAANLAIGESVSQGLVRIVTALRQRPRWLIAKGGITSSDVAVRGLGVRRAVVLGQALPGVPVWQLGAESRWPGLAYIVFPGNVGTPDAIRALVERLDDLRSHTS